MHLNVAVSRGPVGWPVLVALHLQNSRHGNSKLRQLESRCTCTHLVIFLQVGYHDDGGTVKFPYHSPKVWEGGGDGSLGGNVRVGLAKALRDGTDRQG